MARALVATAILVTGVACRAGDGAKEASEPNPKDAPRRRASLEGELTGRWQGRGGSVEFREDGSVFVSIEACDLDPDGLDWTDACQAFEGEGPYEVERQSLWIDVGDGVRLGLLGFVDLDGQLHLSSSPVLASIASTQNATIPMAAMRNRGRVMDSSPDTLSIDGTTCRWRDGLDGRTVESECHWRAFGEDGLEALAFDWKPRWGEPPYEIRRQVIVYSHNDGLVMSSRTAYVKLKRVQ